MSKYKAIIISGPTASGKTNLAEYLYRCLDGRGVIVNADSMQSFESLKKLTAVPSIKQYHMLYGYKKYFDDSSLGLWFEEVRKILGDYKYGIPIIVGGTGMYIKSLIHGMVNIPSISEQIRNQVREKYEKIGKEEFYKFLIEMDPKFSMPYSKADKQRMLRAAEVFLFTGKSICSFSDDRSTIKDYDFLHITLVPERKYLYKNCNDRFEGMIQQGVIDEVSVLKKKVADEGKKIGLISKALGYKEISDYLDGLIDRKEMFEKSTQRTRNYAKRQLTWFRHQPEAMQISYNKISSDLEQSLYEQVSRFIG